MKKKWGDDIINSLICISYWLFKKRFVKNSENSKFAATLNDMSWVSRIIPIMIQLFFYFLVVISACALNLKLVISPCTIKIKILPSVRLAKQNGVNIQRSNSKKLSYFKKSYIVWNLPYRWFFFEGLFTDFAGIEKCYVQTAQWAYLKPFTCTCIVLVDLTEFSSIFWKVQHFHSRHQKTTSNLLKALSHRALRLVGDSSLNTAETWVAN